MPDKTIMRYLVFDEENGRTIRNLGIVRYFPTYSEEERATTHVLIVNGAIRTIKVPVVATREKALELLKLYNERLRISDELDTFRKNNGISDVDWGVLANLTLAAERNTAKLIDAGETIIYDVF